MRIVRPFKYVLSRRFDDGLESGAVITKNGEVFGIEALAEFRSRRFIAYALIRPSAQFCARVMECHHSGVGKGFDFSDPPTSFSEREWLAHGMWKEEEGVYRVMIAPISLRWGRCSSSLSKSLGEFMSMDNDNRLRCIIRLVWRIRFSVGEI